MAFELFPIALTGGFRRRSQAEEARQRGIRNRKAEAGGLLWLWVADLRRGIEQLVDKGLLVFW